MSDASLVLSGIIIGMFILFLLNPMKGLVWKMLEQKKQIEFLTHEKPLGSFESEERNRHDDR